MTRAADLAKFVTQRGGNDCAIASIATVCKKTYEEVAVAFELPLDHKKCAQADKGIELLDSILPALRLGYLAAPLVTKDHPTAATGLRLLPTSDEIKKELSGRKATISYTDPKIGEHSLAWDGTEAIDCSDGTIVPLQNITINAVLFLTELPRKTTNRRSRTKTS